jgi:diguanylate cyclase (GGDEF)-like protein
MSTTKPPRFDPMQAMMRRRQADTDRPSPASDYDGLMTEFQQLQAMFEQQKRIISQLEGGTLACPVTGLANARALEQELERSLATARRYGRRHALIWLKIPDFRALTSQLGEGSATAMLQHIASLIRQNIRPTDIAAHPAHGEFAVILNELRAVENANTRATAIADIISQTPCVTEKSSLHALITYGFYVFGQDDEAADVLSKARNSQLPTGAASA